MTDFEKALVERDGISKRDARAEKNKARESLYNILENCGDYDDVEDMLLEDYGLEMDYIMDLI